MLTILPTIDTEGVHGTDPFQQMVVGKIDASSEGWGVYRLANLFQKFGVDATFFVDVYEHSMWGMAPLREVCMRLTDLGFDVQLHTHPGWRDDPQDFSWLREFKRKSSFLSQEKDLMAKLSFEEQVSVLQHGLDLIQEWTGKRPVAHRSGGYSINSITVDALRAVGIPLDSSMHWGHANSHLAWTRNQVVERDGVIEIPVTLMDYNFALPGFGVLYRKSMKTDIDTCSLNELLSYVDQALEQDVKVMNLFMHSYSLINFDMKYRRFQPDISDLRKLEDFLSAVAKKENVRVMSCADALRRYQEYPIEFHGSDYVPGVQVNSKITRLALAKIKHKMSDAVGRKLQLQD